MLTLPDFKQKQILFIQTDPEKENKIKFHNENIVFLKDNKVENRASCHKVFTIFIIGNFSITSELIKQCKNFGVSLFLLKPDFNLYAYINSIAEGNYLLRMRQYSLTDNEELEISKNIVFNKIKNQLSLLNSRKIKLNNFDDKFLFEKIKNVKDSQNLLGIEGNFSKEFFKLYFKDLNWYARMPRVKPDIPNFLLDMGYTYLFNFIDALLCLFGFDTYKGFYHKLFFQRKSLTCDIIEPFRGIIDREVLKIHTLKIVNKDDFKIIDGKFNLKSYKYNKKYSVYFLETIMKNKEEIYNYVLGFYRFLMDKNKNKFPYFKISR
ncbi:MAG: type V CRISPR-associated endonuclease Cas1 [Minisyncoccia bacterium]